MVLFSPTGARARPEPAGDALPAPAEWGLGGAAAAGWWAAIWATRLLALAAIRPASSTAGPVDWRGLAPPSAGARGRWAAPQVRGTAPVQEADGRWRFAVTWRAPAAAGTQLPALICDGEDDGTCSEGSVPADLLSDFPAAIAPSPGRVDTLRGFGRLVGNLAAHGRSRAGAHAAWLTEAAVDQVHGSGALATIAREGAALHPDERARLAATIWFRLTPPDPDPAATWFAARTLYEGLVRQAPLVDAHLWRMAGPGHHRFVLTPPCQPLGAPARLGGGGTVAGELALAGAGAWATAHNARGDDACAPPGSLPDGDSSLAVGILAQVVGRAGEVTVAELAGWEGHGALAGLGSLGLSEVALDAATIWFEASAAHGRRGGLPVAAWRGGQGRDPALAAQVWGARTLGVGGPADAGLWRAGPTQPGGARERPGAPRPRAVLVALARLARGAGPAATLPAWPRPLANPRRASLHSRAFMDDDLRLSRHVRWQPRSVRLPALSGAAAARPAEPEVAALCRRGFDTLWLEAAAEPGERGWVLDAVGELAGLAEGHFGVYVTVAAVGGGADDRLDLAAQLAARLGHAPHLLLQAFGEPPGPDDDLAAVTRALRAAGYRQPVMGLDPAHFVAA